MNPLEDDHRLNRLLDDEANDDEVKLRCRMTLKGIEKQYNISVIDRPKGTPRKVETDFAPSKITMNVKDADLDEILDAFAEQSGNQGAPRIGIDG